MISEVDGFAYFFCNRDESDRRKSLPVLQSLILQLAATSSFDKSIRASLRELWVKKKEQNGHLGLVDCQNQLSESFAVYPTTFVILDALDEVESEERRLLLDGIRKAMSNTPQNTVKLLVAGRPDVLDKSWPTITIQAQDNSQDIEHYVDKEVNSFIQECDMSVAKREKDYIIKTLLEKSDNM